MAKGQVSHIAIGELTTTICTIGNVTVIVLHIPRSECYLCPQRLLLSAGSLGQQLQNNLSF